MATATTLLTTEDLLALPENGTERWLIAGELRERPMTMRNRFHSRVMTCIATELENWNRLQSPPRGQVLTGDAGVRLRGDPDTSFGVDVVFVTADLLAIQPSGTTIVEGAPTLAVEILSPREVLQVLDEKIDALLAAGVPLVWIVDPHRHTVMVHSPGAKPLLFTEGQKLSGEPHLPGFSVAVDRLFE